MGSTATAEIAKMLGSIHDRDHYTVLRDFFELSAISIRNAVDFGRDRETYEMRYKAIAEKYRKEYLDIIASAFAMLGAQILKAANGDIPFADWAGEIYMDSGTSNGKAGQFFTPYSVSRCMAEINFPKEEVLAKLEGDSDRVITIYEPTVKAPSRAQEKAPAEPEAPRPSLASEEPENMPRSEKNGQFCLF